VTSDELNAAILEAEKNREKGIPYMGFFWRDVDFDADHYDFGVCKRGSWKRDNELYVAFMENNKWGYPTVTARGLQWAAIKGAIEAAVTTGDSNDFAYVEELMRRLVPPGATVVPAKHYRDMIVEWKLVKP